MDALTIFSDLGAETRARTALVAASPSAGALVWSFEALARHVAATVARLQARGVRAGDRVALVAAPSPEVFVTIHALAAMHATLVPIHPRLTPAEARVVLDVTAPHHVLEAGDMTLVEDTALPPIDAATALGAALSRRGSVPERSLDAAGQRSSGASSARSPDAAQERLPDVAQERLPDAAQERLPDVAQERSPDVAQERSPDVARPPAPFAIVSTSGTTGRPKGAVLSRRAFLASAEASAHNLGWRDDDRWLLNMPLSHVGGLSVLTRCLVARRAVVLLPKFDPGLFLEAIERHGVTLASVVPTMLRALLDTGQHAILRRPRALLAGGAATPPSMLDECASLGIAVLTTYGLTEACSQVTTQPPRDPKIRLAGSGAPLPGFDLRVADDLGAPLVALRTGRILIRGPALFDGYLQPDGTLATPFTPEGFFDTGDIGELDERGHLHVHARRTDLIVTGGENVYPAEVEQALERFPGVRRAFVFGVPDERWGQIVAAVIERQSPGALSEHGSGPRSLEGEGAGAMSERGSNPDALLRELTAHVASTLAPHKRPRRWAFVAELPLLANGKVDRRGAAQRFEALLTDGIQKDGAGAG